MAGLLEFAARFGAEERCIEHLAGLRWPSGFACAGCGGRQAWRLKARPRVYECTTCHRQESVTAGTVFHRTRTGLSKWFLAAYLMGRDKRGVSAAGTGGGVSDGVDNGAQAASRTEREPGPSAARLARGGRDLHRRPRRPDESRTRHEEPRQEPGCRRRREGCRRRR